ncbi:MAG: dihydroneopterin aldolase [Bacteroidota bacterium]|jgi:dihydroneopterin aldolase
MLYSVILKKVQFFAYHGLFPEEATKGNEFEVNLSLTYYKDTDVQLLEDSIDYVAVYDLLKKQMAIRQDLLEVLAQSIALNLKKSFPQISKIELEIIKLHPPIEGFDGQTGVSIQLEYT